MQHDIPAYDNPAVKALLVSPQMRALMYERGELAKAVYQGEVAKRTGRLARSARVATYIGGRRNDRWYARLTVGGVEAPHGPAHEFGYDDGDTDIRAGTHDLNAVLNALGGIR
ncbi:hypothetical protein [Nocardia wallacei]|uniref:hypothetical protein n=1 Tax=Nocardia wallacei TaxID=480035 RepID=UPI0024565689|nr:hypothetical protein [Nocardia wallacei]